MSVARIRLLFRIAAGYGLLVLLPYYFMERRIGIDFPPPITHPEFFYGFLGVAVAWQLAFLVIASDPLRFRPIILAGIVEKLAFGVPAIVLVALGRSHPLVLLGAGIDLGLAAAFVWAFVSLRDAR
jgi:hypothetical protein